jgi:hypothetical protein
MEANLSDGIEYNDNKNIKVKKKRGRPKKVKEEIKPPTQEEIYRTWLNENRKEFFNYNQKPRSFINMVYEIYNWTWNSNKSPGKCGICTWDIIHEVKKKYYG